MDLDALARLIGTPTKSTPPIDWHAIEAALGLCLPDDYKSFATAYGPIELGEFISLWSPSGASTRFDHPTHEWLRASRDLDPPSHPYTFWPEPGGLLLWGRSRASHHFFWDTAASSDPRRWPTVAYSYLSPAPGMPDAGVYSGPSWRRWELSMTDFVAALVNGDLGTDFARVPGRTAPDLSTSVAEVRLSPPAPPAPGAVDRIVAASGTSGPARPNAWADEQVPDDFRELVDRLGPVLLGARLRLHAPAAPEGFDLAAEQARAAATVRIPAAIDPQPGGLRLWGRFTTGETCWWLPAWHEPAGWPVVICAADGVGWQRIDLTASGFIEEWLAGRLDLPVLSPAKESSADRPPLALLATLLGPPDSETVADWSADERALGTRLPADYLRLHAAYGELFVGGISIPKPGQLATYHEAIADFALGDRPAFPDHGGLLYCGGTENRDSLWWDTTDPDPDAWPVVVERAGVFTAYPGNFTRLLVDSLAGRVPMLATGSVSTPPRRPT